MDADRLLDHALHRAQTDPVAAIAISTRALTIQPDDSFTLGTHGIVLSAAGRYDEALDFAKRSAAADPSAAHGWLAMASIFRDQKRDDEMVAAAGRAMAVEPENVDALVTYGAAALERLGRLESSKDELNSALSMVDGLARRALHLEHDSAEALALLAQVMATRRDYMAAQSLLDRALAIDPQLPRAHMIAWQIQSVQRQKGGLDHLMLLPALAPQTSDETREILLATSPRPAFIRLAIFFVLVIFAAWGGGWWWLLLVVGAPAGVSGGMILIVRRKLLGRAARQARRRARELS